MDETPLWVLGGVGGVEDAMRRRRLDVNCNSGDGTLDSCLSRECGLSPGASSCSCAGVLYGHSKGLMGDIPTELGLCTNLTFVALWSNQLTGPIPSELGKLTSVTELRLFQNQLTGPIPSELGKLTNLDYLILQQNELTGPIPSELGMMTNLTHLYLYENQLTGPIPSELGQLTKLTDLIIDENCLNTSAVDCSVWPSQDTCDYVTQYDMDDCGVCGGDNSTCVDCLGVPNGADFSSCVDCAGVFNGQLAPGTCGPYDALILDLNDLAISFDERRDTVNAEITIIQDDVESVNASLQSGLTEVQGHVDTVNAEITTIQDDVESVNASLQSGLAGLTVSIDELLTQMSTMQSRIDELEASRRDSSSSDDNEDVGLYVGIGLGCAAVVGVLIGMIYLLRRESEGSTVQSNDDVYGGGDTRAPTHDI